VKKAQAAAVEKLGAERERMIRRCTSPPENLFGESFFGEDKRKRERERERERERVRERGKRRRRRRKGGRERKKTERDHSLRFICVT